MTDTAATESQRTVDDSSNLFERQTLLLRRLWELLEGLKQLRNQLPVVACALLLAVTGFVLNSDRIPSSRTQAIGIGVVLLVLTAAGVWIAWVIRGRYAFVNNRITHLYRRMGIRGEEFFPDEGSPLDDAKVLFTAVYLVIGIIGVLCAVGVMLVPLQ